ncbi:MAG: sigma 54-interacting transcriptional regulator [Saprospiraceae bacterium]
MHHKIHTFGELKASGYKSKSVKQELRDNLINKLSTGETIFEGIQGYEDTVIPSLERAILSGHNINFLGLRGQAKTKMARLMVRLLDEYIPVVKGSEINDDPFQPLSRYARTLIHELGEETPISWLHRDDRYTEKLATPDVNIADLIGDIDPIKAANQKLNYSSEEAIHFGLIPRSNRGIFVINELPDLQPRIQVSLFNILQEGDVQIRGFKLRFPLDVQFIFTANPEDYTSRGAIITPLKDRIQAQIFTHYPDTIEIARQITQQEVKLSQGQEKIKVPHLIENLIEQIAFEARESEYVDEKSGVSARLAISAYESVVSAAELRMLQSHETKASVRIGDLMAAIPAIVGKIEMVYEGEQEGAEAVAHKLIRLATEYFNGIDQLQRKSPLEAKKKYKDIISWFEEGNAVDLFYNNTEVQYKKELSRVQGLKEAVQDAVKISKESELLMMEYLLYILSEYGLIDWKIIRGSSRFQDYLFSALKGLG